MSDLDPTIIAAIPVLAADPLPGGSDVARQRREHVIEAAVEIIATRGLHELSLKEIEKKTGMARGHLTYYFPRKEDILLAVFDRMLGRMIEQAIRAGGPPPNSGRAWECIAFLFGRHMRPHTPEQVAFGSLLHTFLAQIGYRDDYRAKIAQRNAEWRDMMATDIAASVPELAVPPAVLASVVMAMVQGLAQQLAVDPAAFDRPAMLDTILHLLAPMFRADPAAPPLPPPRPGEPGEPE
ncbi:MAG: TetR/AcrR family transcriptional regulator [Fimbriiglobus sp.]